MSLDLEAMRARARRRWLSEWDTILIDDAARDAEALIAEVERLRAALDDTEQGDVLALLAENERHRAAIREAIYGLDAGKSPLVIAAALEAALAGNQEAP